MQLQQPPQQPGIQPPPQQPGMQPRRAGTDRSKTEFPRICMVYNSSVEAIEAMVQVYPPTPTDDGGARQRTLSCGVPHEISGQRDAFS